MMVKAVATALYLGLVEKDTRLSNVLAEAAVMSLMGAVPFALLWVWITARLDPVWAAPSGKQQ